MNQQTGFRLPSFFLTETSPCPYLEGLYERKLFTHLVGDAADSLHNELAQAGFRRSQTIAYRPACENCFACRSVRVNATEFSPSRSQRRIINRNVDLTRETLPALASREQYDVLRAYLDARHEEGGMAEMTSLDFIDMVEETNVDTQMVEYRSPDGRLLAALLRDRMRDGFSLVYSFFDPIAERRSLGSYVILDQIQLAAENGMPFVYLGYLVGGSRKMEYKKHFQPLQELGPNGWVPLQTQPPAR